MYPVFKAVIKPTGQFFTSSGPREVTQEWHRCELVKLGTASSFAEAKQKWGRTVLLGRGDEE